MSPDKLSDMIDGSPSGAIFSAYQDYRYVLWRTWDKELSYITFIMYNPSSADTQKNDPTIRKCIYYAQYWGFGGILVGNLFAYRSSNPRVLEIVDDPVGPLNDRYLSELSEISAISIAAWGNGKFVDSRASKVKSIMGKMFYLDLSKSGNPKHPLYLPKNLKFPRSVYG